MDSRYDNQFNIEFAFYRKLIWEADFKLLMISQPQRFWSSHCVQFLRTSDVWCPYLESNNQNSNWLQLWKYNTGKNQTVLLTKVQNLVWIHAHNHTVLHGQYFELAVYWIFVYRPMISIIMTVSLDWVIKDRDYSRKNRELSDKVYLIFAI